MVITNSPDITLLQAQVTFDLSGVNPVVSVVNMSQGSGLANVEWWFELRSPSTTLIHEGTEGDPDITGAWATHSITDSWPKPFNQIEWSGAQYQLNIFAKDSVGNINHIVKTASICRPFGNTPTSKNAFGQASASVRVLCDKARVLFEDKTNHSYKGIEGTQITSVLRVLYPLDETQSLPDPLQIGNFSVAMVPISYSNDNYQYVFTTIYDYDLGDYVIVRIKYQETKRFAVWCNIDLCPLSCEIARLIDSIENGTCADVQDANRKLNLINSKFTLAVIGKMEPLCGIDVPAVVEEIKQIGGFTCDCCSTATGIIPTAASVIDGYVFQVVSDGGDVNGSVSVVGSTIQFHVYDKKYVVQMYPGSPPDTTAFTWSSVVSGDGFTKTYYLHVNGSQLAEDILNIIKDNGDLVNLFNSIVANNGAFDLIVDGGCIFNSSSTCDYDLTLSNIPTNTTYALLTSIKIGSIVHSLSYSFNLTNLGGLQTYLNALGFGTFVVSSPSANIVLITSDTNSNDIQSLTYKISGTTYIADLSRDCTGYVAISASEVVQKIINYLCEIDDTQVATSQDYTIPYVNDAGEVVTVTVPAGSSLNDFILALIAAGDLTIQNIGDLADVSCDTIKDKFTDNQNVIKNTDFLFATKNGQCSRVSYLDVFKHVLITGITDAATKDAFCAFVVACAQGLTCAPYDYFDVLVTNYDSVCSEIVGIEFTLI